MLLDGAALEALADDIRAHGLFEPIMLDAGVVIDGRNRLLACNLAGVEPRLEEWSDKLGDVVIWIVSKNIHRRHLTPEQKFAIYSDLRPFLEADARAAPSSAHPNFSASHPRLWSV